MAKRAPAATPKSAPQPAAKSARRKPAKKRAAKRAAPKAAPQATAFPAFDAEAMAGKSFKLELSLKSAPEAEAAAAQFAAAGLAATATGQVVQLGGDIGKMLTVVLQDAEAGFRNDEGALQQRYGQPARVVLANWWKMMSRIDKSRKLEKRVPEAKAVTEVMKKGIEPAHNYFGIESEQVSNMVTEMLGLLAFYVIYTVWWGYAIMKLMEGFGLVLKSH